MTRIDATLWALVIGLGVTVTTAAPMWATVAGSGLLICCTGCAYRRLAVAAAIGSLLGALAVNTADRSRLGACADGSRAIVDGRVTSSPETKGDLARFQLDLLTGMQVPRCGDVSARRLRVSWYGAPALATDELWQFELKLRSLRNFDNPGAFNYRAWAAERGIDGTATVQRGVRLAPASGSLAAVRARVGALIDTQAGRHAALYRALMLGDGRDVAEATWNLLRATGTIHLAVISGLHVGIAAAVGAALGAALWRLALPALRRVSDHRAAALGGIACATTYAALAGFGVPALRAWAMCSAALWWWSSGRSLALGRTLLCALTGVLILDPLALRDGSLWLSFGAVAALAGYFGGRRGLRWGARLALAQAVLWLVLLPLLAVTVGQFSWLAPIANLIAVPLVTLVLVPVLLCALPLLSLAPAAASACFTVADLVTDALLAWLELLSTLDGSVFVAHAGGPTVAIASAAAAACLLPAPYRWRAPLLALMAILMAPREERPAWGEVRLLALDVGQGLALIVDTAQQRLLVDAGARYPSGFDLGQTVVLPALRATGAAALDLLLLSHADLDHAGGADAVRAAVPVRAVLAGEPERGAIRCRRGLSWQWSGVRFRILGPANITAGNAASCVLHIGARSGAALLPGDIDAATERVLQRSVPMRADLLIAAHHGSRSSSSVAFLGAVAPRTVIVSAGARNGFGHPHLDVLKRYATLGASVATTAVDGALYWHSMVPHRVFSGGVFRPSEFRTDQGRSSRCNSSRRSRTSSRFSASLRNAPISC